MSVFKIDSNSTREEIKDFYNLYVEAFKDLCIFNGKRVIHLDEYIKPSQNISEFFSDVEFTTKGLGIIIYYTHNDDVVTSIALIDIDNINRCFATVKFLCGNQNTKDEKINGKSQGKNMLDFIFSTYSQYVILIEPATSGLINYYTSYRKPSFPYDKLGLQETYNFLVYGNLRILNEECFESHFRSIKMINILVNMLKFTSIDDLYSKTHSVADLKDKLRTKLEFLIKTKQLDPQYYEQILDKILGIQYYDIDQILIESSEFIRGISSSSVSKSYTKSGGRKNKKSKKQRKNKKRRTYRR